MTQYVHYSEVAIGVPEVAWVGLWLVQPRSSAETIKSQNLWLESSESPFLLSNLPLTQLFQHSEVAIGLPEVAWVGLWLEQPRSSADTIKSQNLWLESSESPFLPSNLPLTQ